MPHMMLTPRLATGVFNSQRAVNLPNYDNRNHHFPSRQLRLFARVFAFGIDARLLRLAGEQPREQKPAGAGGQRIAVLVLVVIHAGDF